MTKKIILPVFALSACFLINCGGGSSTKYKIKFAGENYKIHQKAPESYAVEIEQGEPIGRLTGIKADYGYVLPEAITIDVFKSGYDWDSKTGEINFNSLEMPDKDITITITVREE